MWIQQVITSFSQAVSSLALKSALATNALPGVITSLTGFNSYLVPTPDSRIFPEGGKRGCTQEKAWRQDLGGERFFELEHDMSQYSVAWHGKYHSTALVSYAVGYCSLCCWWPPWPTMSPTLCSVAWFASTQRCRMCIQSDANGGGLPAQPLRCMRTS